MRVLALRRCLPDGRRPGGTDQAASVIRPASCGSRACRGRWRADRRGTRRSGPAQSSPARSRCRGSPARWRTRSTVGQSKFSKPTSLGVPTSLPSSPWANRTSARWTASVPMASAHSASAEFLARASEHANADQIEADLDRLDDLERREQADAAAVERSVREPVPRRERFAAGVLERLDVVVLLGHAVAQHRQKRLRRRARRVLDRGADEGHAELLLGDEEVQHLALGLVIGARADDLGLNGHGLLPFWEDERDTRASRAWVPRGPSDGLSSRSVGLGRHDVRGWSRASHPCGPQSAPASRRAPVGADRVQAWAYLRRASECRDRACSGLQVVTRGRSGRQAAAGRAASAGTTPTCRASAASPARAAAARARRRAGPRPQGSRPSPSAAAGRSGRR